MGIRPKVVGFDVENENGEVVAHVLSFAEATAEYNKIKPKLRKRRRVRRKTPPCNLTQHIQSAIRDDRKHISRSLGVPVAQVGRFNKELENFGVTDARYSKKTGFIESTSDNGRNAAWAIRGRYNPDGGSNADRWANALGF